MHNFTLMAISLYTEELFENDELAILRHPCFRERIDQVSSFAHPTIFLKKYKLLLD